MKKNKIITWQEAMDEAEKHFEKLFKLTREQYTHGELIAFISKKYNLIEK